MKQSTVEIISLTADTVPYIFDFVLELAHYEKSPDAVITTVEEYISAFERGLIDGHLASIDGSFVGCTLFYMTFSTWKGKCLYLEDFYIQSEFRHLGIGQLLFDAYIEKAKALDAAMVKWQVLDWNSPAIKFYEKNNAIIDKEWWNGKIYFK